MDDDMRNTAGNRRFFLGLLGSGVAATTLVACGTGEVQAKDFPVSLSEAQWRKKLTKAEFYVLREEGTERPYS
ncbi:MAG: peptide-methionine (R)-S-oxide reductase, partial [Qipengyuania vulgaris]